ncbi:MAG TPA: ATP-binding protein, partial [Blastocatellia bacterium]|nr:ATP-binding protein [Blastocatellia bacterium]
IIGVSVGLYLQVRGDLESSPIAFLVLYLLVAPLLGLALIFVMVRWLLKPYRRMVEAARGSPVRPSAAKSESEFVVETFQALVERLHAKEKELEQLHALERNRAERSERFSERLIANIPSGLLTIDSSGIVTAVNAHANRIVGRTEDGGPRRIDTGELMTLSVGYREFFRGSPGVIEMIAECLNSGTAFRRGEVEIVLSESGPRKLGLSITPITDSDQRVEGALCLMTDITEVVELRERMKLQENLANLGEMAAGLAHEFKNSLATIHGYVQLLDAQATSVTPEADRHLTLDATLTEVRLLSRLVTDFLNFARPQLLNLTQVSLREIVLRAAAEVKPQLESGGIVVKVEGEFATLTADESMLGRVFVNLLRNAAEAIDSQSANRLISIEGWLDSGANRRYAHVRISDTGSGISGEDLPRIFIPFFTTKSRGYGIGLALVQKIMVAHGGDVAVERSDASGTVFHCRLPLAAVSLAENRNDQTHRVLEIQT